ncbi:MAG: phytoene/squalene synthase family protein [Polaromonas sp.]|nr:phytoene/squalene synthase family protein [Gemmatimonadaceae bacterium]
MISNDEAHCLQIVRTHARTFALASRFLPAEKRSAAFALYAFCRVADDLVDVGLRDRTRDVSGQLASYRERLDEALAGRSSDPVFRGLQRAAQRYEVPASVLHELLDGVARDCTPTRYATWSELSRYCEGVASSVGEMCTYVFGVAGDGSMRTRALAHARTLGVAMQLTNILRDVGEDARMGRCYLPDEDLARFGMNCAEVLSGEASANARWKPLMRFEIARARALYDEAMPGIGLLAPDARRCAAACAIGYAGILRAIEMNDFDTFTIRARVGTLSRASALWSAWRTPLSTVPSYGPTRPTRGDDSVTWA